MNSDELRNLSETKGFTMAQLSECSGVPIGTLQKILDGTTKNPRKESLDAIERVLIGDEDWCYGKIHQYSESVRETSPYMVDGGKNDRLYTAEDYFDEQKETRFEIIDGIKYDMATPSVIHQRLLMWFGYRFETFIQERKGNCIAVLAPSMVQLDRNDKTFVEPDMYVVCDSKKLIEKGVYGAPDFILEILSPSTRVKDMTLKTQKYKEAGVREYWMLDPKRAVLITYNFEEEDFIPVVYQMEGTAPVQIYQGELEISLEELGRELERLQGMLGQ